MAKAKPGQVRLKFNHKAFQAVRNDHRMRADVLARAERIADAAATMNGGDSKGKPVKGYKVTDLVLEETRAAASVMATRAAHHHNRKHATLLNALDAVKG